MTQHQELLDYVARQRWFAGKGGTASLVGIETFPWLIEPGTETGVRIELPTISDGVRELVYNIPMSYRAEPDPDLAHALVGMWELPEGTFWAYDAVHDPEALAYLFSGFLEHRRVERGGLTYERVSAFEVPDDARSVLLNAEQSNSSVVIGDMLLLKMFRTVLPGRNPDIEVLDALTAEYADSVVPLRGCVSATLDGEEHDLAMLQDFLRTATDGWDSARASVRDLLAEGDLHADEVGGDFAAEAERLGMTVAHVHEGLVQYFPTTEWGTDELEVLTDRLTERWESAVALVPSLGDHDEAARACFAAIDGIEDGVPVQRVHGDLHLGQTLRTTAGWKIIDFEGEPGKPLAERKQLDSSVRDLAGMLRSFDYAANSVLVQLGHSLTEQSQATHRAREWVDRNRAAFLRGYGFDDDRSGPLAVLLRAYEVDKAAYEVVYEARNRRDWLGIPLAAINRLL